MKRILITIIIIFLGVFLVISIQKDKTNYRLEWYKERNVELVNVERARVGLTELKRNELLDESAQMKAEDIMEKKYWAHVAPDGTDPWSLFISVGYNYHYAGENLARDFLTPESAVEAWMASESHKENILDPWFEEIGVGVAIDGKEIYIVNHFGDK